MRQGPKVEQTGFNARFMLPSLPLSFFMASSCSLFSKYEFKKSVFQHREG